jgi:Ser/Thr protein kinase RdoA (MazF antagonist)
LAQLHNIGAQKKAPDRLALTTENFGYKPLEILSGLISPQLQDRYFTAAENILSFLDEALEIESYQRIHGDCHRGNVLMTDEPGKPSEFFLIDFDDFVMGPPVQDFWMLFRQDEEDFQEELDAFLKGYQELRQFDENQLELMEPLRGLRIIHYASWIARRWEDPSFPQLFPQFGSESYWLDETQALEKISGLI